MAARVPTPPRRKGESAKAHAAFADYCRMGAGRTLDALHRTYTEGSPEMTARAVSLRWLKEWSRTQDWQARVSEFDAARQAVADEEAEREMLTGLALPRERVRLLKEIADGITPEQMRAALLKSPASVAQLRGILDDLARETGGRKATMDVTSGGKTLGALPDLSALPTDELARLYRERLGGEPG